MIIDEEDDSTGRSRHLRLYYTLVQVEAGGSVRTHHQASGADAGKTARTVPTFSPVAHILNAVTGSLRL